MMILQRDSSAATRAARSDGSRAVVLRGALFRVPSMGRTGDSRAHVEVPLRRDLVNRERLHVSGGVQHLGRPRAEIQGHHLRLVPHAVVGPVQLRDKGRGSRRRRDERLSAKRGGRKQRASESGKKIETAPESRRVAWFATAAARPVSRGKARKKTRGRGGKAENGQARLGRMGRGAPRCGRCSGASGSPPPSGGSPGRAS